MFVPLHQKFFDQTLLFNQWCQAEVAQLGGRIEAACSQIDKVQYYSRYEKQADRIHGQKIVCGKDCLQCHLMPEDLKENCKQSPYFPDLPS